MGREGVVIFYHSDDANIPTDQTYKKFKHSELDDLLIKNFEFRDEPIKSVRQYVVPSNCGLLPAVIGGIFGGFVGGVIFGHFGSLFLGILIGFVGGAAGVKHLTKRNSKYAFNIVTTSNFFYLFTKVDDNVEIRRHKDLKTLCQTVGPITRLIEENQGKKTLHNIASWMYDKEILVNKNGNEVSNLEFAKMFFKKFTIKPFKSSV